MKKILVATDASEDAKNALKLAVDVAEKYHADIELLHVINPQPYQGPAVEASFFQELVRDVGGKVMDLTLEKIELRGIPLTQKVTIGNAVEEILKETEHDIDLVVMGTRGQGALRAALMGSVAQKVVAGARCPVLVVK